MSIQYFELAVTLPPLIPPTLAELREWYRNGNDMKTKRLEGAVLDYWVSRALQTPTDKSKPFDPVGTDEATHYDPRAYPVGSGPGVVPPYSTDWGTAGPVIDRMSAGRNGICLTGTVDDGFQADHASGATPLVALMRSFVVSVFAADVPG